MLQPERVAFLLADARDLYDDALEPLRVGYGSRHALLLDTALYDGILEPAEDIIRDVHATLDFIQDAEQAAGS